MIKSTFMSKISIDNFNALIAGELPLTAQCGVYLRKLDSGTAEMVLPYSDDLIRPGGTIAGPFMMLLADVCMYAVVLSLIGEVKLAVTTNLNINFLRKPANSDLVGIGKVIKMGKRLAVIEVSIYSEDELVAHTTGTYSIPPQS